MDETRKLLDSLMGQSRNQSLTEAKKNKGKNFTEEGVCKFYLLGFCPLNELAASKMLGKRNIMDCRKTHSDFLKEEYETSSERDKYQAEYEKALLPVLEGLVREADAWVARERANVQKTELATPETAVVNNMPPSVKEQLEQLTEDMNKMMAAAEEVAEKGDVEGSKFKVMLAGEIKAKIKELEEKYIVTYTVTHRGEEVCEICGTRTEAATASNHARYAAHFQGKVHLGYVKIREWIKTLRKKERDNERPSRSERHGSGRSRSDRRGSGRSREGDGDRDRSRRSRSKDKEKEKEKEKEKRGRSRGAEGEAERKRRRSRSRSRRR
mmetsp:Transcript_23278/g.51401  ORF Transcript_23278/g.51401 Transcript_23278/m.51401 type:complete len:325 (-) Transcript_23278:183-1157(-)